MGKEARNIWQITKIKTLDPEYSKLLVYCQKDKQTRWKQVKVKSG